jgi:hypothetical protein
MNKRVRHRVFLGEANPHACGVPLFPMAGFTKEFPLCKGKILSSTRKSSPILQLKIR